MLFFTEEGVKHYFNTHVMGFKEDAVKLIRIRKPIRNRLPKFSAAISCGLQPNWKSRSICPRMFRFIGVTDDVGGGGISFLVDAKWPIKQGTELDCWLLIPYRNGTIDHAQFRAEVVRVKPLENGKNQIMAKFSSILDTERQRIIRYCFERQLDFRKQIILIWR